jgi:cell division protein FtsZ
MINIRIQPSEVHKLSPKITVVGVGGAGGNAVNNMISSGLEGCNFLVCNTDAQALEGSLCENRMQLGASVTGGLGAGAKPEVGQQAAEESLDDVMQILDGANMVFITAGMGGGTGTGAAPVIARTCRDSGILTVGVVTKPFHFEGTHRMKMAEAGIEEMQGYVDTLIVIPNQNLFRVANEKTTFADAFRMADNVLRSGVGGVTDLMVMPGLINLDFADIRSAMLEMGKAMMGSGEGDGERRAIEAAEAAINNPLLDDVSMKGARGVIINVTGGNDMTLFEVDEACNRIRDEVDQNANIIFGSTFDDKLEGRMRVSVVATGIDAEQVQKTGTQGGVKVTAISNRQINEKTTVERARPQAESSTGSVSAQPVQANIPARPLSASASVSQAAFVRQSVPKAEEPETDMFEQREFTAGSQAAAAPRGQMHQGHFIPPRPVVAEPQDPAQQAGYYAPQISRTSVQQTAPQEPDHANSLVLHPPVPGAGTAERAAKKTPSLFERITGNRRDDAQGEGDASSSSGGGGSPGGFHAGLRAQRPPESAGRQGSLNIDSPAAQRSKGDEELDIPAFLRRQAN